MAVDMLQVARGKVAAEAHGVRMTFLECDAEALDRLPQLQQGYFDALLCASAFVWMSDMEAALALWRTFLRSGGVAAVHCYPENAFVQGKLIADAAREHGHNILIHEPTACEATC